MSAKIELNTPLGPHTLKFESMQAFEALGQLPEYTIVALSDAADLDPYALLGKAITISMELAQGGMRHVNAHVTRFRQTGFTRRFTRYEITAHPWLWFLMRSTDCRIFQNLTVPDILREVFSKYPNALHEFRLSGEYAEREYCVQYRESDFQFVSRLMEEEGIHYYFTHSDGQHTLVATDNASHKPFPGYATQRYLAGEASQVEVERVYDWTCAYEVQSGTFVLEDYDYSKPRVALHQQSQEIRPHPEAAYEVYDYPGNFDTPARGEHYVRIRMEEQQGRHVTFLGRSNSRGIATGHELSLVDHPRDDQNRAYLITSTRWHLNSVAEEMVAGAEPGFDLMFTCIDGKAPFRPLRKTPRPIVRGPQTAVVVGPAGEEIYTDEQARVKVHFHWDRHGKEDENSSCWLRVSYPMAGKGWGAVQVPRIGQEVIVDFLEGDPDRPIITGRVYNAVQAPPYAAPGMVSGMKSQTHKGKGFNAMSMDDSAGQEKIDIHAQHDMATTVLNDQTNSVRNNRNTTVDVDDSLSVTGNRTTTIKGKHSQTIVSGQEVTITGGATSTISGGATRTINDGLTATVNGTHQATVNGKVDKTITSGETKTVTGGKTLTITGGGKTEDITGPHKTTVNGAANHNVVNTLDLHADDNATYSSNTKLTLSVDGSKVEVSPSSITIEAGGSTITVNAGGVSVNGTKISLNC
ncbi:MAG: type VI secretion system tip protein TssI/VgrG [Candidatus Thiodiazotropha sp.]